MNIFFVSNDMKDFHMLNNRSTPDLSGWVVQHWTTYNAGA